MHREQSQRSTRRSWVQQVGWVADFMRIPTVWASIGLAVLGTGSASAHHSYAAFDMSTLTEFQATVKSLLWTNPHSLLIVAVTGGDGTTTDYNIEMNGPGYLVRNGWKRDSLKPGDKITVTVHPLHDGSPGGDLVKVVFPDGRTLATDAKPPGLSLPGGSASEGYKQ
jgi:hypothetical protein